MRIRTALIQRCLAGAGALIFLASIQANDSQSSPAFHRVLFLGNSITRHGPKESIGWSGNWGMAASAPEKDFVHLVTAALAKKAGSAPETLIESMAGFEREYATYDLKPILDEAAVFKAGLVILAIGENVPQLGSDEAKAKFADSLRKLLKGLCTGNDPVIVVRSCFWANKAKDEVLRQVCEEVNGIYVDIGPLGADESNYARSERKFAHKGVAAHPGDKGMRAIADAILGALGKSGRLRTSG